MRVRPKLTAAVLVIVTLVAVVVAVTRAYFGAMGLVMKRQAQVFYSCEISLADCSFAKEFTTREFRSEAKDARDRLGPVLEVHRIDSEYSGPVMDKAVFVWTRRSSGFYREVLVYRSKTFLMLQRPEPQSAAPPR